MDISGDARVDKLTRILTDEELDKIWKEHGKWAWDDAVDLNMRLKRTQLINKLVDNEKKFVKFTIMLTEGELHKVKKVHGADIYYQAKDCN